MAYILSSGAVLRLLVARPSDPLVQWLEQEQVRPFIASTTMATVRHLIRNTDQITHQQRTVFEKRYEQLARDLTSDRRNQVISASFDLKAAEVMSDILPIDAGRDVLSDMELIPAAIAMQHNYELVVTDAVEAWEALRGAIAPELGRLTLKAFPTGAV